MDGHAHLGDVSAGAACSILRLGKYPSTYHRPCSQILMCGSLRHKTMSRYYITIYTYMYLPQKSWYSFIDILCKNYDITIRNPPPCFTICCDLHLVSQQTRSYCVPLLSSAGLIKPSLPRHDHWI